MSSSKRERAKPSQNNSSKIIIGAFVLICIGYYMLNYIAKREDPPLGNTFHIIMGCALMAIAAIAIFAILKKKYFPKKKRRSKSRPVFLNELPKKDKT